MFNFKNHDLTASVKQKTQTAYKESNNSVMLHSILLRYICELSYEALRQEASGFQVLL